jgi:hypothetical protein
MRSANSEKFPRSHRGKGLGPRPIQWNLPKADDEACGIQKPLGRRLAWGVSSPETTGAPLTPEVIECSCVPPRGQGREEPSSTS